MPTTARRQRLLAKVEASHVRCDVCLQPIVATEFRDATRLGPPGIAAVPIRCVTSAKALHTTPAELARVVRRRKHKRPSTAARGYGPGHEARRRKVDPLVQTGTVPCARCGELIEKNEPWDLDHRDDRRGYLGPSHARCNRSTRGGSRASGSWRGLLDALEVTYRPTREGADRDRLLGGARSRRRHNRARVPATTSV